MEDTVVNGTDKQLHRKMLRLFSWYLFTRGEELLQLVVLPSYVTTKDARIHIDIFARASYRNVKRGLLKVLLAPGERRQLFDHQFFCDLYRVYLVKSLGDEKITQATFTKLEKELAEQRPGKATYFPDFSDYVRELALEHTTHYTVKNEFAKLLAFANNEALSDFRSALRPAGLDCIPIYVGNVTSRGRKAGSAAKTSSVFEVAIAPLGETPHYESRPY